MSDKPTMEEWDPLTDNLQTAYERGVRDGQARMAELEAAVEMWTEAHDFMQRKVAEALARLAAMERK